MFKLLKARKKLFIAVFSVSLIGTFLSIIFMNIISTSTGSWMYQLTYNNEEALSSCVISDNGKLIVVGSANNNLYLFEKSSSTPLWLYRMDDDILDVDMSANGQYIVAGADEDLFLFEKTSSTPLWIYSTGSVIRNVGISSNGNYIMILTESHEICLFQKNSSSPLWNITQSFPGPYVLGEISNEGSYIVSVSNGVIYLYNASNSAIIWQYDTGEPVISALTISANGEYLAAGGQDSKIHLFNKTGPTPIQIYSTGASVRSISLSENGTYIAAGCADGFYLFEISNSTEKWKFITLDDAYHVAISSNGEYIIGGGVSYSIDIDYLYLFKKGTNTPEWIKQVGHRVETVDINSAGTVIAASSGFRFYLLNRDNPFIDEAYILN